MVVLEGMPVDPVMTCPTIIPLMLCTFATVELPVVIVPVVVTMLAPLEFPDIVIVMPGAVVPVILVMVVPAGMPTPAVRGYPATNPLVLDTFVMTLLAVLTMPLNVVMVVAALEAVAFTAVPPVAAVPIVIVLPMFVMYVPAGMPVPVARLTICPTASPEVLATGVMIELPLVRMPVNKTVDVETAFADIVIVVGTPVPAVTTVMFVAGLVGMPAPVMGCPIVRPEMLDTPVMVLLPLVT